MAFPHEASFRVSQRLEQIRSAANNNFVKITAENIHCFLAHIGFYLIVDDGHAQQQLTYFVVDKRQDVFLDNLLHNKRHAGDDTRFDFRE